MSESNTVDPIIHRYFMPNGDTVNITLIYAVR